MKEVPSFSLKEEDNTRLLPSPARSQAKAQELFEELALPQRKTETWRLGDVKELNFWQLPILGQKKALGSDTAVSFLSAKTKEACLIPVYNGQMDLAGVELPEGVSCFFLEDMEKEHPEWLSFLEESFALPRVALGSEKVTAWIQSQAPKTTVLHLKAGVKVPYPLHLAHQMEGADGVVMAHTLIWAEEGAEALVVESWEEIKPLSISAETERPVLLSHLSCVLKPKAHLHYASLQALSLEGRAVQTQQSHVAEGAHFVSLLINAGAEWVRQESFASLAGPQAQARLFSASLAKGKQRVDQRTYQDHLFPHAQSNLLYKNTLRDKSKTVFSGMIRVGEGAHFSDAFQRCHNRLLSSEAEAHSLPGLEILADEVKCSHGATNAGISEDELFYLLSRGISRSVASKLLAQGFCAQVLELFDEALSWELNEALSEFSDYTSASDHRASKGEMSVSTEYAPISGGEREEIVCMTALPATSYATRLAWELIEESFSL